jgi:dTDP-4-amino-4,6-dideoxygalactose transaminase
LRFVKLFESDFDSAEVEAASKVVASGWLTNGDKTLQFEQAIADCIGVESEKVVAVSSCTAALHLSLILDGVGFGDEVIVPALNFVSDANVCVAVGARPVFCDIESLEKWTPDVSSIERLITPKTKAMILTHFAGIPAPDVVQIAALCRSKGVTLIEDCAHALGASLEGKNCGTFGDYAAFSFYSNKNIATGEGGALLSNRASNARQLRSHGMTTSTLDREKGRAFSYDVIAPGLNYRIDEIRSAIGLCQIAKFDKKHAIRRSIVNQYLKLLEGSRITSPFNYIGDGAASVDHIMPILLPSKANRNDVMRDLLSAGIQTSIHYPAPWNMTAYQHTAECQLPISSEVISRELTLPLHTLMKQSDATYVVEKLHELCA